MSLFSKKATPKTVAQHSDYLFLERLPLTVTDDQAAQMYAFKQALTDNDKTVVVLSGSDDPRADQNFVVYRDKGHFFLPHTEHQNFFLERHRSDAQLEPKIHALPIEGYLGELSQQSDYGRNATMYVDSNSQIVYRVDHDEQDTIIAINYFAEGKLVRTDTYDNHQRLLFSEQFGDVANFARITDKNDARTVQGLMSRTLYDESGRPVFAQTYSPQQLWLLRDAVPKRLFNTEAGLMAWWLVTHLDGNNKVYVDVDSQIFAQLASYEKLRPAIIPIVHTTPAPELFESRHFQTAWVNEVLAKNQVLNEHVSELMLMPNWRNFKKDHSWSVYTKY